jgi:tetratricopeptide (TPR) repeat protein
MKRHWRLAASLGDAREIAEATYNLAFAYGLEGRQDLAAALFAKSRKLYAATDNKRGVGDALSFQSNASRARGDVLLARGQAEESMELHHARSDLFGLMDSLHSLGRAALDMGDLEVARSCFIESLDVLAPLGYRTLVAIMLDSLAAVAIKRGRPLRAIRLGGASEALKEAAGGRAPAEFMDLPDPRGVVSSMLTAEQIEAAWAEGKAMSFDEAVELARSAD